MPKLTIENDGSTFEARQGESLQDIADERGAPIPFGCRAAACGTCRIEVVGGGEGLSAMDDPEKMFLSLFAKNPGPNDRLACQCRLVGDATIKIVDTGNYNHPEAKGRKV